MERAYREDELIEASVIDSEGYIYGKVEKINIEENGITLKVHETKPDMKTVVDISTLESEFLKKVKMTLTEKLQRLPPTDILAKNIRKELGLGLEQPLNEDSYVKYAERLGIPIPYKKVSGERKEPKGTISLGEIKTIKTSIMGAEKGSTVIKAILLNEPREASFRNIPIHKKVAYQTTDAIKDKLVFDSDGTAIGYVDSIVLFRNSPGIRVYSTKVTGMVSLSWLDRYLEQVGRPDVSEAIKRHFKIERGAHVYQIRREDLEDFMQKTGLTFTLPEDVLFDQSVKEFLMDIPWDAIHKVGDVVLLRLTLAELRSKGYER